MPWGWRRINGTLLGTLMLIEIPNVKQYEPDRHRRWFQNAFFDLYVWNSHAGELLGFQLCYEKGGDQRALRYSGELGYQHEGVDQPEDKPGRSVSAIFVANGALDAGALGARFAQDAIQIPASIRDFVIEKLGKYDGVSSGNAPASAVNDDEMFRLLGNNPEKLAQLAQLFATEHRRLVEALDTALFSNAFAAAKSALHGIKGMSALMGAKAAAAVAARLESIIAEQESSPTANLLPPDQVHAEFIALQNALLPYRHWFARWGPSSPPIDQD